MKKSTRNLLLLAAAGFVVYKVTKAKSDTTAALSEASAQAMAPTESPAAVPAGSSLSGSTLAGPTLYSRAGMGIFG